MRNFSRLTVLVLAVACGDSPNAAMPEPPLPIPAVYTLRSVDGGSLPATIYADDRLTVAVVADTLTLVADGTFARLRTLRLTEAGVKSISPAYGTGSYAVAGGTITLRFGNGASGSGSVASGALTVADGERTYAYRR